VSLFRRRESLHVRLAREGGLLRDEPPPHDTRPRWGESGIHGVHRLREWDEVATVEADGPVEDEVEFVVLPDGTLVGDEDEVPLADGIGLEPPFRAHAVLRGPNLWVVAARRIRVEQFEHPGEEIQLTRRGEERTLLVDGERAFGRIPALEALAPGDAHVRARRIDGSDWEVRVDPL
jgi:hypothetical protein